MTARRARDGDIFLHDRHLGRKPSAQSDPPPAGFNPADGAEFFAAGGSDPCRLEIAPAREVRPPSEGGAGECPDDRALT
jgi:hypothetical protein